MPRWTESNQVKDEIALNSGKYLIETSKGEILYKQSNNKYWEQREQAIKVSEYWTKNHAVYVHLYRIVGSFPRWVGSFVGGRKVLENKLGF